jgi:ABC-type transport system involved in multi-copper enzyme maturation permease subunit
MHNSSTQTLAARLRIIWAVAAKDVLDAVRSRTTLSILIMVPVLLLAYRWLPHLYSPAGTRLVVYDMGHSPLIVALENDPDLRLYPVASMQELASDVTAMPMSVLGLILPADVDQSLASGDKLELAAYVAPWTSRSAATTLASDLETRLSGLVGQVVRIEIQDEPVYPTPDSMGPVRNVAVALATLVVLVTVGLVPYLMLEERQTRTLDSLLVSPATVGQVVAGKALAGTFYGLLAALAAFAVHVAFVSNWGLAILATLSAALLGVSVGLLLGSVTPSTQGLMPRMLVAANLLLAPVFLNAIEPILPQTIQDILRWIPTVALSILFRMSFAQRASPTQVGVNLGLVIGTALVILVLVAWKVRQISQ